MRCMKAGICVVGMMLFLYPVVAMAQGDSPPARWWRIPELVEKLDLNPQEKQALETLFVQKRKVLYEMRSEVEKQRFELDSILEMPKLDDRAALKQFKKLEGKRYRLAEERFTYLLEVRRILGQERYIKLMAMASEQRGKRGRSKGDDISPR